MAVISAGMTMQQRAHGRAVQRPWAVSLGSAGDAIAVDLLRNLDPERLILYGGRRADREDWVRHCRQQSEDVLVATSSAVGARQVAGTLEMRVVAGAGGDVGLIDRLYVDARHRRRGIASRLLRAAIALARGGGPVLLRENIPYVLVRDAERGCWQPHISAGEGWGGLRSLGATVNACARAGQPCAVAGARLVRGAPRERIDAILVLPVARAALAEMPRARAASSGAALRSLLLGDLADAAGVALPLAEKQVWAA